MTTKSQTNFLESLPDPLVMLNGERVNTVEEWIEKRRPEVLELFRRYVYGRVPIDRPQKLRFTILEQVDNPLKATAFCKQVEITFEGPGGAGCIHLLLFTPKSASSPRPCFLLINNRGRETLDPEDFQSTPFWPVERILARGYATAAFDVSDVDPDEDDDFHNGVHGIFDPPTRPRAEDAWGTISAWAWGASRAMDYLETDPLLAHDRIAVIGHSRGGKTALWCGAQDERFALAISNESGCTGAALARGTTGETIRQINTAFPHWFCRAYRQFNDDPEHLLVDQHLLLALMAPRRVYVASAQEDAWADPQNEFLACVYAEPVYQLFGLPGLGIRQMPPVHTPQHSGYIGYHLRAGSHDLIEKDWDYFMDYTDAHWNE